LPQKGDLARKERRPCVKNTTFPKQCGIPTFRLPDSEEKGLWGNGFSLWHLINEDWSKMLTIHQKSHKENFPCHKPIFPSVFWKDHLNLFLIFCCNDCYE